MRLKTKLKKYEEGSVFELKIDSEKYPEYNDKYIYLIKSSYIYEHEENYIYFYAIITDKRNLEELKNIDNDKLVKTLYYTYEARFLPISKIRDLSYRKKVKFYPDKYGYLWANIFQIMRIEETYSDKLNYIGKIDFKRPEKEYIPFSEYGVNGYYGTVDLKLEDYLINLYELFNKQKAVIFTKEGNIEARYNSIELLIPILYDYKKIFDLDDKFNVRGEK